MECWQYLIKKEKSQHQNFQSNPILSSNVCVEPISYQEAKDFILEYEWLGNMGWGNICFGLRHETKLIAVVVFGSHLGRTINLNSKGTKKIAKAFQLHRGASAPNCPTWGPSYLIRRSLKEIQRIYNSSLVFCYADPQAGEVGTIYQACGAVYLGLTDPGGAKYLDINGILFHPRKVYRIYGTRNITTLTEKGLSVKAIPIHKKHRYVFILGSNQHEILKLFAKKISPYPKRTASSPMNTNK
ncbi:Mom family adenine methylcarbamoylation protein [Bdellovibrio sp. GT3]|uniref:Mom family adenine methylcarbamoylation protein n=1 Tax=Bdellovibrio sp. GT3 TaxID=3136282 RepID=UPI0030F088C2